MVFISSNTSVALSLNAPQDCCCNCGDGTAVKLVKTPLKRTRYFLFFGTELTLNQVFPYCKRCAGSAIRIRQGLMSKLLGFLMMMGAVFLLLLCFADDLPKGVGANLFMSSMVLAALLTFGYFFVQERGRQGRSYYQPVQLIDVDMSDGALHHVKLDFYNPRYAELMTSANRELIATGMFEVGNR